MSTEETKATVRRIIEEVWNEGDLDAVDRYLAMDVVEQLAPTGQRISPEAIKEDVAAVRSAIPDIHVTIEDVITEGDKVAFLATWRGTHQGEFRGTSPTGESIVVTGIGILRLADDKIVGSSMNTRFDLAQMPDAKSLRTSPRPKGDDPKDIKWPPRWNS
jgi:steroid delta-isomerase-like uncharacterized protein